MPVRRTALVFGLATLVVQSSSAQAPAQAPPLISGQLGVAGMSAPKYIGSDERWVLPIPIVDLRIAQRVYVGGDGGSGLGFGGGLILVQSRHFSWTADVTLSPNRPESRADALAGMGDRGWAVFGGTSIALRAGVFEATGSIARGFKDEQGLVGVAGLSAALPLPLPYFARVGGQAVFGDCDNVRWDFGVTQEQADRRAVLLAQGQPGLRPGDDVAYDPTACGLRELRGTLMVGRALNRRMSVFAMGVGTRLERGAAASPLVRQRNGWMAIVGLGWRL